METSGFLFDPSLCRGNMLFLGNGGNPLFQGARSMMTVEESSKKRPFFGSADEFFDEEYYYDEQGSDKKRRLTAEQVHLLEKSFETENKLEPERKTQLAKKLGLQPRQVAVWFQNRRARWKTKQLERDYDLLKSSYDSLLNKYDNVAKQNYQLKSEVISLSEKLQPKEVEEVPNSNNHLVQTEDIKKVEEWVSSGTGSGGSAVVDEESPQLVDSGDSYNFPCESFVGPIYYADEDDGSDDFSNVMAVVADHHQSLGLGEEEEEEEEEQPLPLEWWMWMWPLEQ